MEIISLLAAQNGFKRYLELCTSSTGWHYAALDRTILTTVHRLMYNCPASFDDGLGVDFRSESMDISRCIAEINSSSLRYDIILVDPWHEYSTSLRDLQVAFDLIRDDGMLVVHDCMPPNAEVAAPEFIPGAWCGVTYKAYLDFVCARPDLDYRTVDIDYGCGIIRKLGRRSRWADSLRRLAASLLESSPKRWAERRQRRLLWSQWHEIGNDFERTFSFFEQHKTKLLNLISPEEFWQRSGSR